MITTRLKSGRVMLHNGDFAGDLYINAYPRELEPLPPDQLDDGEEAVRVVIPFEDIKEIVAAYIRNALIMQVEAASADWLLLGPDVSPCQG